MNILNPLNNYLNLHIKIHETFNAFLYDMKLCLFVSISFRFILFYIQIFSE